MTTKWSEVRAAKGDTRTDEERAANVAVMKNEMREAEESFRPKYPHLENLERILVHVPDYLSRAVTVTEKLDGMNARVGRDADGTIWYGTRNQDFDLDDTDSVLMQGFKDYVLAHFRDIPVGITIYGEWAGKGIQKGVDYGEKDFYLFGERRELGPVRSSAAVLDQHWVDIAGGGFVAEGVAVDGDFVKRRPGVTTVPVIYEGAHALLDVLDELRRGTSIVAPGQPIEGIVIAPIEPVYDQHGHQLIAKYKSPTFSELTSVRRERLPLDMTKATGFADEYVNTERLRHVLEQVADNHPTTEHAGKIVVISIDPLDVQHTGDVLKTMYADVVREGADDFAKLDPADQKFVGKVVNKATIKLLNDARGYAAREAMIIAAQEGPDA